MTFKSKFNDVTPDAKYKNSLSLFYWLQLDKWANKILFHDLLSNRTWTGREIKQFASRVASFLLNELPPAFRPGQSCCLFLCPNTDYTQLVAMGTLFAGGSVFAGYFADPKAEHRYMVELVRPDVAFVDPSLVEEVKAIQEELKISFRICIMDHGTDDGVYDESCFSLKRDIFNYEKELLDSKLELPIWVEPDTPAYILLTSGSTGKPKAVGRTQRNSLYVCHSLDNCQELWDLNESSVFSGHLALDYGTGIFSVKMTLAKGMLLVIMARFEEALVLEAIERFRITDMLLASAPLHNLMSNHLEAPRRDLSSLRNIISVGSRLPSHELACEFMRHHNSQVSVRQCLGMTECGIAFLGKRADCFQSSRSVGHLLPNFRVQLRDLETGAEIGDFNREGELYLAGPSVCPGYACNSVSQEQQRAAFKPDGFYRTFDVCYFQADGQLVIKGRRHDVLYLSDGGKILPDEVEHLLLTHEAVLEAAVVGVPHPDYPIYHMTRAYVVPKREFVGKLTPQELVDYSLKNLSRAKCLDGGVKLLPQGLPRRQTGKIDKLLLKQLDGLVS